MRDGLRGLGPKIAAGFLNISCVRTVEKFALRVVGNPRRFSDYEVTLDLAALPAGVTVEEWI